MTSTSPTPLRFASVELARRAILERAVPLPPRRVELAHALGLALTTCVDAPFDLPLADQSTLDGYAIRSSDLARDRPLEWVVLGVAPPGPPRPFHVGDGQAVRVYTGSVVPAGSDCVVAQEEVEAHEGRIRLAPEIAARLYAGHAIRKKGSDFGDQTRLLDAGRTLRPADLALLATVGQLEVEVTPRPRVAIVCTGDELIPAGTRPMVGQVPSANGVLLANQTTSAGAMPELLPDVPDDLERTIEALERAAGADVVLTSGGASVSDRDLLATALARLGAEFIVHKVAMRPGKPLLVSRLRDRPVFCLPGNPAGSFVAFELFVRPFLARMLGRSSDTHPRVPVTLTEATEGEATRAHYVRACVVGDLATPLRTQTSGALMSIAGCNALLEIPRGTLTCEKGSLVWALLLPEP